jgi:sulfane dehydrogenase subunit SoxC
MSDDAGAPAPTPGTSGVTRRGLLAGAAAAAGGALLGRVPLGAQPPAGAPTQPEVPADPTKAPGPPTSTVSARSPFEHPARAPVGQITGASLTPLQELSGTVTPSDLHFERHHGGVALIDPTKWELLVHGLVDRPTVFTLDDLERLPSVSRMHFIECAGNGRSAYRSPPREHSPQQVDGMMSGGEWTGVLLSTLFREVGVRPAATWFVAEGGDSPKLSRSIPVQKGWDDALVAYAYNGEPMRPQNGYPARLVLPGWEGNTNIKWLRRVELVDGPRMFRDETSKYTDPLPNDTARQFSFEMDVKSVITRPAYPGSLGRPGWVEITGLAWSGRGRVTRVDVSTDGGRTWTAAALQEPVLAKSHTRFRLMWRWEGGAATLMSRAADETGAVQPTRAEFQAARGAGTDYHYNHIRAWVVEPDGRVLFGSAL